jgi:hypothetical protein
MAVTLAYIFQVTIPPGTLQAAPLVTPTTFEPNEVEHIEWLFPHGCNGLVGIQIGARSVPVLPPNGVNWYRHSGSESGITVEDMPVTGDWSVIGYNLGVNPHTIDVTFKVRRLAKEPPLFTLLSDADLSLFPTFEPVRYG